MTAKHSCKCSRALYACSVHTPRSLSCAQCFLEHCHVQALVWTQGYSNGQEMYVLADVEFALSWE